MERLKNKIIYHSLACYGCGELLERPLFIKKAFCFNCKKDKARKAAKKFKDIHSL